LFAGNSAGTFGPESAPNEAGIVLKTDCHNEERAMMFRLVVVPCLHMQ
jgi:hypothetical protein